jgi:hypothetical protein
MIANINIFNSKETKETIEKRKGRMQNEFIFVFYSDNCEFVTQFSRELIKIKIKI